MELNKIFLILIIIYLVQVICFMSYAAYDLYKIETTEYIAPTCDIFVYDTIKLSTESKAQVIQRYIPCENKQRSDN